MTRTEIEAHRQNLLDLSARLRGEVAILRDETLNRAAESEPAATQAGPGEMANHQAERAVGLSVLGSEEVVRAEVEAALARIDAGTFGLCPSCGKPIPQARMRAVPYARFCLACAKRDEAGV